MRIISVIVAATPGTTVVDESPPMLTAVPREQRKLAAILT